MSYIELVGLVGGLLYLAAFFEVSLGKWNGQSFWYEAFNLSGAVLLGVYAVQKQAYMNIVLNIVWGVVALYGIRHIALRHQQRKVKVKIVSRRQRTTRKT